MTSTLSLGGNMARSIINCWLLSLGLAVLASPAAADSLKFYTGSGASYPGGASFTQGAGSVYGLTQANSTNCPSVGTCVSDNIAPILTFNVVGNTITVTSTYGIGANVSANSVWGDFSPSFGGLGAGTGQGTLHHNTDDQLNGYETLHI